MLIHYELTDGEKLTNLGILLIGTKRDRSTLGTAPVIQAIRYDERGEKIWKNVWDDYTLSPIELVDAVHRGVPDFDESYEFPEGLLRTKVPAYDDSVVRELLVNALVHRPYTQRGDIFLMLHPDRLQIVNVGRLPLGVMPDNILHQSRRRNDGLARVFHDLGLMEREDSGFDMMYDRLLTSGRAAHVVTEDVDSVCVVVHRWIALIAEDVGRYPDSAASDIHRRVGGEVQSSVFRRALKQAVDEGRITTRGETRWRRYYPPISIEHEH